MNTLCFESFFNLFIVKRQKHISYEQSSCHHMFKASYDKQAPVPKSDLLAPQRNAVAEQWYPSLCVKQVVAPQISYFLYPIYYWLFRINRGWLTYYSTYCYAFFVCP